VFSKQRVQQLVEAGWQLCSSAASALQVADGKAVAALSCQSHSLGVNQVLNLLKHSFQAVFVSEVAARLKAVMEDL